MGFNSKLALGTVQFGLDYGISNKRGKIPQEEVNNILNFAYKNGIDTLDTAYGYGESEAVLGEILSKNKYSFKIISKVSFNDSDDLGEIFYRSLARLGVDKLYGYLFHDFKSFHEKQGRWDIIQKLREEGRVQKIGFSLYYPKELEYLLENKIDFNIVQVPYNIFDQRFNGYFYRLKKMNIEIHVRSIFLQGLVFKEVLELSIYFKKFIPKLNALNDLSKKNNIPLSAVCLNFGILNEFIDKIVLGIDEVNNLKEIIKNIDYLRDVENLYKEIESYKEDNEKFILPTNWE